MRVVPHRGRRSLTPGSEIATGTRWRRAAGRCAVTAGKVAGLLPSLPACLTGGDPSGVPLPLGLREGSPSAGDGGSAQPLRQKQCGHGRCPQGRAAGGRQGRAEAERIFAVLDVATGKASGSAEATERTGGTFPALGKREQEKGLKRPGCEAASLRIHTGDMRGRKKNTQILNK